MSYSEIIYRREVSTSPVSIPTTKTGLIDSMGREICVGDVVLDKDGFKGKVVFCNGAYRYDIDDGHYLIYHSSLFCGDGEGPQLTVVKRG